MKALNIALNDIRITLREPAIWVNVLIVPAALIFVIALANGQSLGGETQTVSRQLVDIVDNDNSPQSAVFIETLASQSDLIVVCPQQNDADDICQSDDRTMFSRAAALTRVEAGLTRAFVEIPAGFGTALISGEDSSIIYNSRDDVTSVSLSQQAVSTAVQRVKGIAVAERIAVSISNAALNGDTAFVDAMRSAAADIWAITPVSIETITGQVQRANYLTGLQQSVPGMGSMYVMFLILAGASTLVQERKRGTLQRIAVAPVSTSAIIGGKLLARFVLGMLQYAVAFAVGLLMAHFWGVSFGSNPLALIVMMASFALCVSTFTLLLATLVKTPDQAGSLVTLVTLILAPIGGAWWSLDMEFIPEFMRTISVISPFKWVIDGFRNVIALEQGFAGIVQPAGVLLAAAAVFFVLAVRRFKVVE